MNSKLERLINIAKESGELTEKQREIILRNAELSGEDVDEVEMILETAFNRKNAISHGSSKPKVRKCRVCGATVSSLDAKCPECGALLENESESSTQNRDYIAEVQSRLDSISQKKQARNEDRLDYEDRIEKERLDVIHAFSVPFTKEAQIMAFNYAKGRFEAGNHFDSSDADSREAAAWLGKAKEFYNNVAAMSNPDSETRDWIKANESILQKKANALLWMMIFCFIVIGGMALLLHFLG